MATPEEIMLEEQAKKSAAMPVDLGLRTIQPQNKGLTTTSISDTTTQTRYTQPVKPKFQFTNDNLLEALMAEKPVNKPVLDENNQKRIMNRGKLDALGRVVINIGDSLTLGMGGSPVKRDKSETDQYFDKYYQNVADHQKRTEDWEYKDYLRRLQTGQMLTNQRDQDQQKEVNDYNADTRNYQWQQEQDARAKQLEDADQRAKDQLEEQIRSNKSQESIQRDRIDPSVARGMYDMNGRTHEYDLKASDVPNVSAKAKSDSEFLNQHPEFFVEYRVGDTVDPRTGEKTPVTERKLNINDTDLAVAYLNRLKDKRVVPLSEIPASTEARQAQSRYQNDGQQQQRGEQQQSNAIVIPDEDIAKLNQLSTIAAKDTTQRVTNAKEAYKILRSRGVSQEKAQEIVKKDYSLK